MIENQTPQVAIDDDGNLLRRFYAADKWRRVKCHKDKERSCNMDCAGIWFGNNSITHECLPEHESGQGSYKVISGEANDQKTSTESN